MLSILMPVYNERNTVARAIEDAVTTEIPGGHEVIVIDDGSTDGSGEILRDGTWPDEVTVVAHERNMGKGTAIRTGLQHARGDVAAILDADLEYRAADLIELLAPLQAGETNAVFGVRAFNGYSSHSFLYVLGNRGVTLAANVLFNVYIGDLMTCHKVIRTDVFRALPLRCRGFDIEPEIAARLVQRGERIFEIPVQYKARAHEEGKKLTTADGFRVLWTLLRCRLTRA